MRALRAGFATGREMRNGDNDDNTEVEGPKQINIIKHVAIS